MKLVSIEKMATVTGIFILSGLFWASTVKANYLPPCYDRIVYHKGAGVIEICENRPPSIVEECFYQDVNGQPGQLLYCNQGSWEDLPVHGGGGGHR